MFCNGRIGLNDVAALIIVCGALAALAPAPASAQDALVFVNAPSSLKVGPSSSAFHVERQPAGAGPVDTSTSLTVTLSSTSTIGQFSDAPVPWGTWSSTFDAVIPAGAVRTAALYYRDGNVASPLLSATGVNLVSGTHSLTVLPVSLVSDFETGALYHPWTTPQGDWSDYFVQPNNSLQASVAAAHRGAYGFRLVDAEAVTGAETEATLIHTTAPIAAADHYLRFWFRMSLSNEIGGIEIVKAGGGANMSSVLSVFFPGADLWLAGRDGSGLVSEATAFRFTAGSWYLIELASTGLGTRSGTRSVWIDGQLQHSQTGKDWSVPPLSLSETYAGIIHSSDRRWTGTLDYDDFRITTIPPASHFHVTAPAPLAGTGSCVPVAVSLSDSVADAVAPAPYAVEASVKVTGISAGFYSDSTCATPASTVILPTDATSATIYLQPTSQGTATLEVTHLDFLSVKSTLSVGSPISVSPASASVAPQQSATFAVANGAGGYTWSIAPNNTGATVSSAGVYTAGPVGNAVDTVRVTDAVGAEALADVRVGPPLVVSPDSLSVKVGEKRALQISGGAPPYLTSFEQSRSGGFLEGAVYSAGLQPGVIDVVRVVDSLGVNRAVTISVEGPDQPLALQVGCACDAGGAWPSGPLVWLLALLQRRRFPSWSALRSSQP